MGKIEQRYSELESALESGRCSVIDFIMNAMEIIENPEVVANKAFADRVKNRMVEAMR